ADFFRWMHNPDSMGCDVVTSRIDNEVVAWNDLIGSEAQGVSQETRDELCKVNPLPETLNPIQQKRLNQLAVESFFQMFFAEAPAARNNYRTYFVETMAKELPEISVELGAKF
ncbi:MAG: hypothetical protein AAF512_19230, partial [Pseudomonadota bacterium]